MTDRSDTGIRKLMLVQFPRDVRPLPSDRTRVSRSRVAGRVVAGGPVGDAYRWAAILSRAHNLAMTHIALKDLDDKISVAMTGMLHSAARDQFHVWHQRYLAALIWRSMIRSHARC